MTPADELDALPDDRSRAQHCRAKVEAYRNRYFAGRAGEIAYVRRRAAAGDHRFAGMSDRDLEITGKLRWGSSGRADEIRGLEQMWGRWAAMYVEAASL